MDISVVIPTLKPREEVEAVEHLEQEDFDDYEVLIQNEYPVTKARNEGAKAAQAEKIVFIDDDSRPREGYLRRVSEALETEDALSGRTVHPRNDIFEGELTSHYDFGDEPRYINRFWGCNMAIRKEVLADVGWWDEQMGWGHEEKELADRVIERYRIYYEPEAVVDHPYANSISDYWLKQYKLEKQTPYYWDRRGMPVQQQWLAVVKSILNPLHYVRRTPKLTLVKAGGTLARGAGRIMGLAAKRRSQR
jgi:GT2 family glycosyltransferase